MTHRVTEPQNSLSLTLKYLFIQNPDGIALDQAINKPRPWCCSLVHEAAFPLSCDLRYSAYIGSMVLINASVTWYMEPEGSIQVPTGSMSYVVSANRNSYITDQVFQVESELNVVAANMKLGFAYQVRATTAACMSRCFYLRASMPVC